MSEQPIIAISDLHMGVGDARDNFRRNEQSFAAFMDWVESINAQLVICGDLFELWQNNVSHCIDHNLGWLDRFHRANAVYVLGNHDADFEAFTNGGLTHPFFSRMCLRYDLRINNVWHVFVHGHEVDAACRDSRPGLGRISAIYTGLWEDRNGSPYKSKYKTVENAVLGKYIRMLNWFKKITGNSAYGIAQMNRDLISRYPIARIICGHTHQAGTTCSIYNTGTWAEFLNTFVQINPNGDIEVRQWSSSNLPKPYTRRLPI